MKKNLLLLILACSVIFVGCTEKRSPTKVSATINGTVVTVVPDTRGATLKAALHAVVNYDNIETITKILIDVPDVTKIIPETDLSYLFSSPDVSYGYSSLTTLQGLEYLDTSNVTNMSGMFSRCYNLTKLDISTFNTENVTDMGFMFDYCSSIRILDVSSFNTAKVSNMGYMFARCHSITSLNLSNFNTESVTDMSSIFFFCDSLTTLNISGWKTNKITSNSAFGNSDGSLDMFLECTALKKGGVITNGAIFSDVVQEKIDAL